MNIFHVLTAVGGLCLFLFGMSIMGQALERRAGGKLRTLLGKLTTGKVIGLLTGLTVTAAIQSSTATTVMVVGFVNSGLMTLRQAIHVIMGANIGTTVTAWILSLSGIDSKNFFVKLLKPSSFTPILALVGILFYLFSKNPKRKDTGTILLGFTTLMFGMEIMSDAVSGLRDVPTFQNLFIAFQNPILGILAGAVLTAVIQSSSASVGILQALAATGQVSYGAAIPIIMGQNIGTCVTALLSSIGATKNAKRTALVHLSFNVIGSMVWLAVFCLLQAFFHPPLLEEPASLFGIAIVHSIFNVLCTILIFPLAGFLEFLVCKLVPDAKNPEPPRELDERFLQTPSVALERCQEVTAEMAEIAVGSLQESMIVLFSYSEKMAESIRQKEKKTDHYEDIVGSYLVKLSSHPMRAEDSAEAAKLLKLIGDFERISDYALQLLTSAQEMQNKKIVFTESARSELNVLLAAVDEILKLSLTAFLNHDLESASDVEPLDQVINRLKEELRNRHISRLQQGECSIEAGFIWSDLLTDLGRASDHCSNIAGCLLEMENHNLNLHSSLDLMREESHDFQKKYQSYRKQYSLS